MTDLPPIDYPTDPETIDEMIAGLEGFLRRSAAFNEAGVTMHDGHVLASAPVMLEICRIVVELRDTHRETD